MIVFEISAVDRRSIVGVKDALRQKAEEMVKTVQVSYEDLEEFSAQSRNELMSLRCTDVDVEIGNLPITFAFYFALHAIFFAYFAYAFFCVVCMVFYVFVCLDVF